VAEGADLAESAESAPLADGTVDVWWARRQDAWPHYAALLDQAERRRWHAYRREADRDRFLVGCALAKTVLAGYTGLPPEQVRFDRTCRRCGEPHGKPAIRGGGIEHSVSHSGDLVAVAVARSAVGVDVEQADGRPRPLGGGGDGDPERLGRLVLADDERAALAAADPAARAHAFLVAWTRKEAVTKATGDGLGVSFKKVVVSPAGQPARLLAWPYPQAPEDVSLFDLDVQPGYVAALAVIGRCAEVRARDGSALLS
jgi:4'-phosphopantetheinyl transferase